VRLRIALASDHAGFHLKEEIKKFLEEEGLSYHDFGTYSPDAVDYPDQARIVAEAVARGEFERGILFCGTGIGVAMAANKVPGIRAALCHDTYSARASREHNDANILALGGRVVGPALAREIVSVWLRSEFLGGRHERRIAKIAEMEREYGERLAAERILCGCSQDDTLAQDIKKGELAEQVAYVARELLKVAGLKPGDILVAGCSTSEIAGQRIGTASSLEIGEQVVQGLLKAAREYQVYLAAQCCEHLNRALVVEAQAAEIYNLEEVTVVPVLKAGGALATAAYRAFHRPVVVSRIQAHAGIDIGDTLIGMHLRPVAVPVRLGVKTIGSAHLTMARTRPALIGGERAVYR